MDLFECKTEKRNSQCEHRQPMEQNKKQSFKAAYSVTFFEKFYFLFKSFVKVELSYVFTIKMFSTADNCMEK